MLSRQAGLEKINESIRAHVAALREYAGGEAMLHVLGLLSSLEESYKERLADVAVGDLLKTQGAIHQVRGLRESIFGPTGNTPLL